jgi:hypothetical protein
MDDSEADLEHYLREIEGFASGDELFNFLDEAWSQENEERLDEANWEEIVTAIETVDARLATEVAQATQRNFNPPDTDSPPMPLTPLQRSVAGATWAHTSFGGGGAMWAAIAERTQGGKAIALFAQRYLQTHGVLPQGEHRVRMPVGPPECGADCETPQSCAGANSFDKVVRFPALGP